VTDFLGPSAPTRSVLGRFPCADMRSGVPRILGPGLRTSVVVVALHPVRVYAYHDRASCISGHPPNLHRRVCFGHPILPSPRCQDRGRRPKPLPASLPVLRTSTTFQIARPNLEPNALPLVSIEAASQPYTRRRFAIVSPLYGRGKLRLPSPLGDDGSSKLDIGGDGRVGWWH
jgi:hypothetical protein